MNTTSNPFFEEKLFYFEFIRVIGKSVNKGADILECLYTAQKIKQSGTIIEKIASWHEEWKKLALRTQAIADNCLAKNHKVSAREAYLRAAEYFRIAEFYLHTPENPDNPEMYSLWNSWKKCFANALKLFEIPFEVIKVPYEGTTLPGYFLPAQNKELRKNNIDDL